MNGSLLLALGAVSGAISVMLGAFGAHALKARMSADALSAFQTAVQYQMMHSLALIAVGLWLLRHPEDMLSRYAALAFCFGILFLSICITFSSIFEALGICIFPYSPTYF